MKTAKEYYESKYPNHTRLLKQWVIELMEEFASQKPERVGDFPSDNDIKEMMTKDHSRWKDGKYRRTYWDRVTGGKIVRDFIKQSQPEVALKGQKGYVECDPEKEMPSEHGYYLTNKGRLWADSTIGNVWSKRSNSQGHTDVKYWLKPITIPEQGEDKCKECGFAIARNEDECLDYIVEVVKKACTPDQEPEPTALANSQYREERERIEMEEQDQEPEITESDLSRVVDILVEAIGPTEREMENPSEEGWPDYNKRILRIATSIVSAETKD